MAASLNLCFRKQPDFRNGSQLRPILARDRCDRSALGSGFKWAPIITSRWPMLRHQGDGLLKVVFGHLAARERALPEAEFAVGTA
jgi:hypothetical protein